MVDSNTQVPLPQRTSDAITVTLQELGAGMVRLLMAPSLQWLQDPARVYPVVIDPSVVQTEIAPTGANGHNVTIDQANPTTNYNGNELLTVGKNASGQRQDALIQFPTLEGLPQDSAVLVAKLELTAVSGTAGMRVRLRDNTNAWDAAAVTWNTAPGTGSTVWDTDSTRVGAENEWNVTLLVRKWLRGELPNHGMRLISAGANGESVAYYSSYYTDPTCSRCQPELDVRYVTMTRYGMNRLWPYTSQDYGGGNASSVNLSTGNLAFQHQGGVIATRGFAVDLTHMYNSQDPSGQGSVYGEGWSFGQDLRLTELNNGNAVVFKDSSGGTNRVYLKDQDVSGTRTYIRPLYYDLTLTKDIQNPPVDPAKVYTLTTDAGALKHSFDGAGKLTRIEDRNGNYLAYAYDSNGRLIQITDVAGRSTTLAYNGLGGRLSQITDMAGRVSTYEYDSAGNLTTITHGVGTPDAVTTRLSYDDLNQLIRVTNPRGHTSEIQYQYLNRWESAGSVEKWDTDYSATTKLSHSTAQAHSGNGALKVDLTNVSATAKSNIERDYTVPQALSSTPQELVAWIYLPAGSTPLQAAFKLRYKLNETRTTAYVNLVAGQWNALRFRDAVMDPASQIRDMKVYFQPPAGAPSFTGAVYVDDVLVRGTVGALTDAKPARTTMVRLSYAWDARKSTVRRPDTSGIFRDVTFTYNTYGMVEEVTDPLNNITVANYDSFLRLAKVTPPGNGGSYSYSYYPNSNEIQTYTNRTNETMRQGVDTSTGDVHYDIDPRNEDRRLRNLDYVATVYVYDAAGSLTEEQVNRYAAGTDLEQRPLPAPLETLRKMSYTYGTGGLLTSMMDPNGNVTYYSYDNLTGYLTQVDAPAGSGEASRRVMQITRNADGSVQKLVDPKGQTIMYEYDGLGRLRKINYGVVNGTPTFSVSYTLDANGNMTAMVDKEGSSSWSYDENNCITSESRTQNGLTKTAGYAYYNNGLLSTLTTFGGQMVTLGYDTAFRLVSQTDPNDKDANGNARSISYSYDSESRLVAITFPSGVKQELVYDDGGRVDLTTLKKGDGTLLQHFDYDYGIDANGNLTADHWGGLVRSVTELDGSKVSYGYDDLGRLISATRTGTNPFNQSYTYDAHGNRTSITKDGVTTTATYDAANQMIALGSTSYSYDRNGNLVGYGSNSLSYDASNKWTSGTVNGINMSFSYDGQGRRVSRTVGSERTDYWYDVTGLTLETGTSNATYLRDLSGDLRSISSGGTVHNYAQDRLGSITGLVSTSGALANTYIFDPCKAGKETYGLDCFFSSLYGRPVPG
jgi:YD repeat-containing protein